MIQRNMQNFKIQILLSTVILSVGAQGASNFDPDDCYEPGTNFEMNQLNLGYCPCKYGFGGPRCFDIFDCAIGELRTDNCSRDYHTDFDLQWRCSASESEIVKICTCPYGFRGETCEYILENIPSTYFASMFQSPKMFEIVYNKTHGIVRIMGTKCWRLILEYRRFLMIFIGLVVLEFAWRSVKRLRRKVKNQESSKENGSILTENLKSLSQNEKKKKKRSIISLVFCKNQQKKYEELKEIEIPPEKGTIVEGKCENYDDFDTLSQSSLPSYHTVVDNEEISNSSSNEEQIDDKENEELHIHKPNLHV